MEYAKDKTIELHVRLTRPQMAKLDSIAKAEGVTRSEAMRRVLDAVVKIPITGTIRNGEVITK